MAKVVLEVPNYEFSFLVIHLLNCYEAKQATIKREFFLDVTTVQNRVIENSIDSAYYLKYVEHLLSYLLGTNFSEKSITIKQQETAL